MEKDKLIIELKASKQTVKELKVSLKTYPQKELLKIKEEAFIGKKIINKEKLLNK